MNMALSTMITVDLQEVFRTMSSDILMFVTAMISFAALHHMKKKAARGKVPCKESLLAADTESLIVPCKESLPQIEPQPKQPRGISHVQLPLQIAPQQTRQHQRNQQQPNALKHCPAPNKQCRTEKNVSGRPAPSLALMKKYAAERNIKDTLGTFRLIKQSGASLTSSMYNTLLQAWIKCGNVWAAEDLLTEMKDAGIADESSYIIIIKALFMIHDLEKAKGVLKDMSEAGIAPGAEAFDEFISGFARGGLFKDGITLLNEMYAAGVRPSAFTLASIADLLNSARAVNQSCADMNKTLANYGLQPKDMLIADPSEVPRLVSVIFQADFFAGIAAYVHSVEIKGSLVHLEAVRKTLWRYGCWDHSEASHDACSAACNLDYQWKTEHQLDVSIDQHQTSLLAPSMTKTLRDAGQDKAYQTRTTVVLKSVSKNGLCLPSCVEDILMLYMGNDLHYLHMYFECESPRAGIFDAISCRHPRVGIRHCWANTNMSSCGQRTLVNGDETDEKSFNTHLSALRKAP